MVVEVERPDGLVPLAPFLRGRLALVRRSRGSADPSPSILRLSSWSPSRADADDLFVFVGSRPARRSTAGRRRGRRCGPAPRRRPCARPVAVGEHLAEPDLERTQGVGPFRVIPLDHARRPPRRPARPAGLRARPASPRSRRSSAGSRPARRPRSSTSGPWEALGRPAACRRPAA